MRLNIAKRSCDIVHLYSGFAGLAIIRTNVLKNCDWGVSKSLCSEHNHFCSQVLNYGSIICCCTVKPTWIP